MTSPLFHPYELGFCGYSNSGKTTLISKLVNSLSKDINIGYVKHDVHRFQMDKEGKDTYKAWHSGAQQVLISDLTHTASLYAGVPDKVEMRTSLLKQDVVFLEGYKNSSAPKIVVIDKECKILSAIKNGEITNVKAFAGEMPTMQNLPIKAPYFNRDDLRSIQKWVLNFFKEQIDEQAPLKGLVLAGGLSQRMQQDKSQLQYFSKPQVEHVYELLHKLCDEVYISCRKDQWPDKPFSHLPKIFDTFKSTGPTSGILSAMSSYPNAAWLVVACDLPFLDLNTLRHLIKHRNPFKFASCFSSLDLKYPEPLCTIYEPKAFSRLLQFLSFGHKCPRKMLINSPVKILEQVNKDSLQNINSPHQYERAIHFLKTKEVSYE